MALHLLVVFPDIWMMHLLSFPISLELKGRTLTATFTEAPAISQVGWRVCVGVCVSMEELEICLAINTHQPPAQVQNNRNGVISRKYKYQAVKKY